MEELKIFLDTSIVHRIFRIDMEKPDDPLYEEDRVFLRKVLDLYSERDEIKFYVNPSVKIEIEKTRNEQRKKGLLAIYEKYKFLPYHKTIWSKTKDGREIGFPLIPPASFVLDEEKKILEELCKRNPGLEKDLKILADAAFCQRIDVLLTTDRTHLANKGIQIKHLKIFTPKELFEYLSRAMDAI